MNISTIRIAALVFGTLLTFPVAHAHTPLKASIPEDGAVVSIAEVPLPELVPGEYTVQWRGVAADGHVMSGTLRFTVADH